MNTFKYKLPFDVFNVLLLYNINIASVADLLWHIIPKFGKLVVYESAVFSL